MITREAYERNAATEGWGYPLRATKGHYFLAGEVISICGRWMYAGERHNSAHGFHCVACTRKLEKLKNA